jgi:hypothetical protein
MAVPHEQMNRESDAVHAWRVRRLIGLGVAWAAAEAAADLVDWHEVAKLVKRGCPAPLALAILQ